MDKEKLDEKYQELDVRENEYFQNNIRAGMHSLKVLLRKLDQPVNKTKWVEKTFPFPSPQWLKFTRHVIGQEEEMFRYSERILLSLVNKDVENGELNSLKITKIMSYCRFPSKFSLLESRIWNAMDTLPRLITAHWLIQSLRIKLDFFYFFPPFPQ